MYSQSFTSPWPEVLIEMREYIDMSRVAVGRERPVDLRVVFSRRLVAVGELQPHVADFLRGLHEAGMPAVRVDAGDDAAHWITIEFGD